MSFLSEALQAGARRVGVVLVCGAVYQLCFALHAATFGHLSFAQGVDWVYLPAGVRLALVLVFPLEAALGISLASAYIAWDAHVPDSLLTAAGTGLVSGFSPLLARLMAVDGLGLSADLESLSARMLLVLTALFGTVSAVLHQSWYLLLLRRPGHFLDQAAVMALGDFLGALIVLYLARWILLHLDGRRDAGRHADPP